MKGISKFVAAGMMAVSVLVAAAGPVSAQSGEQSTPSSVSETEPAGTPVTATPQPEKSRLPVSNWRTAPVQTGPSVWGMLKGLALCLAVFFAGIWLLKKTRGAGPSSSKRNFKIIERFPISPRSALLLVELKGREVVLAVGSEHVSVVDDGLNTLLAGGAMEESPQVEVKGEDR